MTTLSQHGQTIRRRQLVWKAYDASAALRRLHSGLLDAAEAIFQVRTVGVWRVVLLVALLGVLVLLASGQVGLAIVMMQAAIVVQLVIVEARR